MQIVIDVDENVFTRLFDNGTEDYEIMNDDLFAIAKSIRNGTPFPKGHWIDTNDDSFIYRRIYKCSHCGDTVCDYPEDIQKYKYCSSCGANMESEE